MCEYTYETATGLVAIRLDEKWLALLAAADASEVIANRKHTRADHKYAPGKPTSLEAMEYIGQWFSGKDESIRHTDFSIDLERAMTTLTKLQHRYVTQVLINGHSYAELARMDGISEAAIRKHVKLAIPKIKKYLFENGSDS
jgi:DNA-directed RNA polymerase specialized sigma24 family protein